MASGDGLLVRVRAGVSVLTAPALAALARLARTHGNGIVELTRRANLQLRGVRPAQLATLQRALVSLGLADAEPERERRLGLVLLDPLADGALGRLAERLARVLADAELGPLPAKCAVVLDAGSGALSGVAADVRVDLAGERRERPHLYLGQVLLGATPLDQLGHAVIEAVRRAALHYAQQARGRLSGAAPSLVGPQPGGRLGVGVPFGAGDAALWEGLAGLADELGDGSVRATPARALLLAGIAPEAIPAACARARALGLCVDPSDPLLRASACPGGPACDAALGETRGLASALAPLLPAGASLHVSGCAKGCAKGGPSSLTVLHAPDGLRVGFGVDLAHAAATPAIPRETAPGRIVALGALGREDGVPDPMPRTYDYERDAAAIYRRSFAIIREEADLARFSPIEERVAVRLVHTSGMVELARDIVFSRGFAEAATAAIARGAPILCDTKMVVSGVTRARLPADNEVLSFVDHPDVPRLAKEQGTTRTAAALALWAERLDGAVVAIGNAPTALFRLLELLDEAAVRPAAIIGLPVGFVGAAESKDALIADGRVPAMIVRGRKGGSAMTAAALNALASERE